MENTVHTERANGKQRQAPWRCTRFPELHQRLDGHLFTQSCKFAPGKWERPEAVFGTKAWMGARGGSLNREHKDPDRNGWIAHHIRGAVHGSPSRLDPPVFGWQPPGGFSRWAARPARVDHETGHVIRENTQHSKAKSKSKKTRPNSAGSSVTSGSSARSQSLPDLLSGELPFPPTAAYVRNFRRLHEAENSLE